MPLTSHHVTRMTEMGDLLANLISGSKRPADKVFCKEIILVDGKALSNWLSSSTGYKMLIFGRASTICKMHVRYP